MTPCLPNICGTLLQFGCYQQSQVYNQAAIGSFYLRYLPLIVRWMSQFCSQYIESIIYTKTVLLTAITDHHSIPMHPLQPAQLLLWWIHVRIIHIMVYHAFIPVLCNSLEEHHEIDSKETSSIMVASQPGLPPILQGLGSLHECGHLSNEYTLIT